MAMLTADRREREKAERRASILSAAQDIFFSKGFHRTTVDEIAARAAVGKGTVYLYFGSKEEILTHLLLETLDRLVAELETAAAPERDVPADIRIRRLAEAYIRFFREHPDTYNLIMGIDRALVLSSPMIDVPDTPHPVYARVLVRSLRGFDLLVQAVEQGVASGQFSAPRPRETAASIWAALNGVLALLANPVRRQTIGLETEALYQLTLTIALRGISQGRRSIFELDSIPDPRIEVGPSQ